MKISTPSIYKKVIQLEGKGLIKSRLEREGKMPEKAVYSLTRTGEAAFEELMLEISSRPVNIFLDLNAVIVNLESMPHEKQQECLNRMTRQIGILKTRLEENLVQKETSPDIPAIGLAVLQQQYALAQAIEAWIVSLRL